MKIWYESIKRVTVFNLHRKNAQNYGIHLNLWKYGADFDVPNIIMSNKTYLYAISV